MLETKLKEILATFPGSGTLPLAAEVPVEKLEAEIEALSEDALLVEAGELVAYCCEPREIPEILWQIGIMRELTFRAAEEGTGRPLDLDEFDATYDHIFVWDRKTKRVVGGYRLGRVDQILMRQGKEGLYTSTLFDIDDQVLEAMNPALELGRSFVVPDYQRSFAMPLLWRGIGAYLNRRPWYRRLIGAVSIDREYSDASVAMMCRFFAEHHGADPMWMRGVRPRLPFNWEAFPAKAAITSLSELSDHVAEHNSGRPIPTLLKHYALLGAEVLAFNVDPDFSNVVDGLICVDLLKAPQRKLARFMGPMAVEALRAA